MTDETINCEPQPPRLTPSEWSAVVFGLEAMRLRFRFAIPGDPMQEAIESALLKFREALR